MSIWVDDDGFISDEVALARLKEKGFDMTIVKGGFTPTDESDIPVLVDRELFEEMVAAMADKNGERYEVKYSGTFRGTATYSEATIYTLDPHPDPLTVSGD